MKLLLAIVVFAGCGGGARSTPPPTTTTGARSGGAEESQAVIAARLDEEGTEAMYAGNYELASSRFREAAAREPQAGYFFNLCTSLYKEGKLADASVACGAVSKLDPTPELADKARALRAKIFAEGRAQGVEVAPEADAGADPATPDPTPAARGGGHAAIAAKLSDEGVQLVRARKYAEASSKFREAVARVPEPTYFFNLCTSLYHEGKFADALTACQAVRTNSPTAELLAKANALADRVKAEAKAQGISLEP